MKLKLNKIVYFLIDFVYLCHFIRIYLFKRKLHQPPLKFC